MSDKIYTLIHQLTPDEKKGFKTYSLRTEGKTEHLRLFNELDKLKNYNEAHLRSQEFTYLPKLKNYLWNKLLKYLSYHKSSPFQNEINILGALNILIDKRLLDEALDFIEKHGSKIQNTNLLKELKQLHYFVLNQKGLSVTQISKEILELDQERYLLSMSNEFYNQLWNIQNESIRINKIVDLETLNTLHQDYDNIHRIINNQSITKKPYALYWQAMAVFYELKNDLPNKGIALENSIKSSTFNPERPITYFILISNLINWYLANKSFTLVEEYIEQLHKLLCIIKPLNREYLLCQLIVFVQNIEYFYFTSQPKKVIELAQDFDLKLFINTDPLKVSSIFLFIIKSYFIEAHYDLCIKHLQELTHILDENNIKIELIDITIKLMLFFCYLEQGEPLLYLESFKNAILYICRKKDSFSLEAIIVKSCLKDTVNYELLYKIIQEELLNSEIKENPLFDFKTYIKCKAQGIKFSLPTL